MELTKIYSRNKNIRPLFSESIIIDFYDGLTTGLGKLDTTEIWLACNMCYFEPTKDERIFTLISVGTEVVEQLKPLRDMPKTGEYNEQTEKKYQFMMGLIRKCFSDYHGKVYLMKCGDINDVDYEIVEISIVDMRYFDDMEDALNQPEQDKEKWLSFFER